jgi:hypothetical protein
MCQYDCGGCKPCEADCAGLECGDDSCGGSCGECAPGEYCSWGKCIPGVAEPVETANEPGPEPLVEVKEHVGDADTANQEPDVAPSEQANGENGNEGIIIPDVTLTDVGGEPEGGDGGGCHVKSARGDGSNLLAPLLLAFLLLGLRARRAGRPRPRASLTFVP